MKNITVSIDEELDGRAHVRAADKESSLSALVKEFLTGFAEEETEFERKKRLQDEVLAGIFNFGGGSRISRDELHRRGK